MWQRLVLGIAVSLAGTGWAAAADDLGVGDPAPKLEVKEFVKGEPVTKFEKGKTYVVEFWATWCGPCRASIPHLTELQKKYKDVTFIGVSVWEREPEKVAPFVKEMGDKMDYRVAVDAVKAGGKGSDGVMAKSWMEAAGQDSIPAAFIVNGDGKIAWIGHPLRMDKPLAQIAAGKWDLAAAVAEFKKEKARKDKFRELSEKIAKAEKDGDPKEALEALDKAFREDPGLETTLGTAKFQLLAGKNGDLDKAVAYGKHLLDVFKDDAEELNDWADDILEAKGGKPDARLLKFALEVARRADKVAEGKDPFVADTLAKAYFENGDVAKAVENQERALKLAKGTPLEKDKELQERLEKYKKALKKD